ncbi:MAG TPA: hypothetical protein DEB05_13145 [Firmicutes bacterium]|nr:hypothetical protein [Bacillota bacterium]
MKKVSIILLALILTLLCANLSMAAGDQSVTVNPFGLLFGQLNGQYEKSLGNQGSFLVNGSYISLSYNEKKITGIGVGGGYRKYLGDEKFSGFFAQGTGNVYFVSIPDDSSTIFGISGLAGFKWLFDQGFTVEAGAGVNMVFGNVEGYNGLGPALALSLGYTW